MQLHPPPKLLLRKLWETTPLFFEFPYVCPKPVLVKCSFLYINGIRIAILHARSSFPYVCPEPVLANRQLSFHHSHKEKLWKEIEGRFYLTHLLIDVVYDLLHYL